MKFEICEPTQFYLRMGLWGPAGSGKTYTALKLATEFGCDKVGIIDTEAKSARRYANSFRRPFFSVELEHFSPSDYIQAIEAAEQAGIEFLVVDSLSHAWAGKGGVLELVDLAAKRQARGGMANSFAAWREITPEHNRLVDKLLRVPMHLIVTLRTKMEYVIEQDARGKSVPRKIGLAPIQREGLEYEFDIIGEFTPEHELFIAKTRCPSLTDRVFPKPGAELANLLRAWVGLSSSKGEGMLTVEGMLPKEGMPKQAEIDKQEGLPVQEEGVQKVDWVARLSHIHSAEQLKSIRERLNQAKQEGVPFQEGEERQIRVALKEAQKRIHEKAA